MSTFEEAYELTGHGIFNYLALLTNGFILLYVTVECLGLGYVLNEADCALGIDTEERGTISAATFIGVVTPAIIWGYLGDAYGRRRVMLPATVFAVIFSVMSSFSVSFMSMFLLRIITGVMISASCATAYVYLGELTSPSHRAASIALGSAFIAGSYFSMPVFAWILLPLHFSLHVAGRVSITPWRVLMWAYTLWGTMSCIGMAILPESPAFLLATKGGPATLEVLAKIYSWNNKKKAEEYPIKELESPPAQRPSFKESLSNMKYLFKRPLLKCVIISHICNFMVFMQSNALYVWMPHVIDELLKYGHSKPHRSLCSTMNDIHLTIHDLVADGCVPKQVDWRVYPIAMVVGVLTAGIYVTIGYGIKKWGKTLVYGVIMGSCAILISVAAVVPNIVVAIMLFVPGLCGIAANTVLAAAIVEVFPTKLRALAMCTLFMIGRLGAALGSHILAYGFQYNCVLVILSITIMTGVSVGLLFLWPNSEETRAEMMAQNFSY